MLKKNYRNNLIDLWSMRNVMNIWSSICFWSYLVSCLFLFCDDRPTLMGTRADAAGTDDTLFQTAILSPTERGPRNEEDLELFQERTSRVSLMLRYAGKAAASQVIKFNTRGENLSKKTKKHYAFNFWIIWWQFTVKFINCFSSHKIYIF